MDSMLYWIWLSLSCTPASSTFGLLWERFSSPVAIFEADEHDLKKCIGSRSKDLTALADKDLAPAQKMLEYCVKRKIGLLPFDHPRYPAALREIEKPPALLYYRGILPDFSSGIYISVVGTRRMSDYGKRNAFSVSHDLALAGATVVSGMAFGIDAVAAAGAIHAGRPTVAVLGCGIDICYPKKHLTLARRIVKDGCILTEYPPGTPPRAHHFPERNRIISGLSVATVVIEGRQKSGSVITARYAKEQGRDVYALPGNVDSPLSEATTILLRNGAKPFGCADDIIRDYEKTHIGKLNPFVLTADLQYPVDELLQQLEIVYPKRNVKRQPHPQGIEADTAPIPPSDADCPREVPELAPERLSTLDETAISIYKAIPYGEEIAIEDLCDGTRDLRTVMRHLLHLEVACFVTILPGERVRRNFK